MAGGAGAADVQGGVVYTGSGAGAQQSTPTNYNPDGAGVATDWGGKPKINRDLWLRIR
jgi:hypothetical protein